jgi:hypothetical protein
MFAFASELLCLCAISFFLTQSVRDLEIDEHLKLYREIRIFVAVATALVPGVLVFYFAHSFFLHIVAPICSIASGIAALRGYARIDAAMNDANGKRIDVLEEFFFSLVSAVIIVDEVWTRIHRTVTDACPSSPDFYVPPGFLHLGTGLNDPLKPSRIIYGRSRLPKA